MRIGLLAFAGILGAAALSVLVGQGPLGAQEPAAAAGAAAAAQLAAEPPANLAAGKRLWAAQAACIRCHGWAGNGAPQEGFPAGANLRELDLDADALTDIIRCGVPGSQMPSFGRGAWYTSKCYDMTAEQAGAAVPSADFHQLSAVQIATLVAYLKYQVIGHGPVSKADCEAYYAAGADQCRSYP